MKRALDTDTTLEDIKEEAFVFLGSLCNPITKDPSIYFLDECLESWVRFYRAFLIQPKKGKVVKNKVKKLDCQTIACFVELVHLIWIDIDGVEQKRWDPTFLGQIVNDFSHFNFALNLCINHLKSRVDSIERDCWISDKLDQHGYPLCHFTETNVKCVNKQQGTRILAVDGGFNKQVRVHRWVCSLKNTGIYYADRTDQAAHRCMNTSCFNPYHLKRSSDESNKDDKGCKYGCAHYCPHDPECIWNSKDGRWLPCRNDKSQAISKHNCTHNPNCFE